MKRFLLILSSFFAWQAGQSQLLTVQPDFPGDTSSVTITVDATKGNQGLLNYANTSDVYVHVGVITNLSTSNSDWRYVPFTWGTTNAQAHAVYLGNNQYQYTISNIRNFFGVPPGETILKVAILFRNGNGTLKQANSDGSDMFVSVYDTSFASKFLLPPFQPKYIPVVEPIVKSVGDSFAVKYVSNQPAHLQVFLNGNTLAGASGVDSLTGMVHITTPGNQELIATADNGTTTRSDTLQFFVGGANTIAPLPSGVTDGINYLPGDTSVVLALYAPHKNKIIVVGDFNNWTQLPAYQMNETPDSNYFWIKISGLTPQTEYAYQYVIDDSITVADYNTEKVLDKNVDPTIPASTYPNLKPFPSQASGTLASIIETGKPVYSWQVTNFQRPAASNLRIYELWLGDFLGTSNWQTLTDTLHYLKALGINAVEVMPFSNFEGSVSWGYNPNFYFAPDKVYGTETALKQFIDACHQQGIAVIMDMVLNHSFGSSPMVQMYFDSKDNIPAANSPWFSQYYTHPYDVGFQFNNSSAATMTFRERVISYWLKNYHIDGYRFDLAKGFTKVNSCNADGSVCSDNSAYDSTRINIWNTLYAATQAASAGSYCILEMFTSPSEEAVYAANHMMVWNNMSYNYQQATMGYATGWDLSGSTAAGIGVAQNGLINYQESHDEERLMYKNEQYGNSSGSYNIKDTATGLARNEMAAAIWSMIPGPKMLWQFGELGYDYSVNWCTDGTVNPGGNCRLVPKPARWDYLSVASRKHLHDLYQAMFHLTDTFPSLESPAQATYSLSGAVKSVVLNTPDIGVVVIGNFDVSPTSGLLTFPTAGTWYNYLGTDSIVATGASQSIPLGAGQYKVYISKKLKDSTTAVIPPVDTSSVNGVLVYPNPVVSSNSLIKYTTSVLGDVQLGIFDYMGQRIGNFDLGVQPQGTHTVSFFQLPFNVKALESGLYVLKLMSGQKSSYFTFYVGH